MKKMLWILFVSTILVCSYVYATDYLQNLGYWSNWQNNETGIGKVHSMTFYGQGATSSVSYGSNFEPMIADFDNDGVKEIAVTSSNYLFAYTVSGTTIVTKAQYTMINPQSKQSAVIRDRDTNKIYLVIPENQMLRFYDLNNSGWHLFKSINSTANNVTFGTGILCISDLSDVYGDTCFWGANNKRWTEYYFKLNLIQSSHIGDNFTNQPVISKNFNGMTVAIGAGNFVDYITPITMVRTQHVNTGFNNGIGNYLFDENQLGGNDLLFVSGGSTAGSCVLSLDSNGNIYKLYVNTASNCNSGTGTTHFVVSVKLTDNIKRVCDLRNTGNVYCYNQSSINLDKNLKLKSSSWSTSYSVDSNNDGQSEIFEGFGFLKYSNNALVNLSTNTGGYVVAGDINNDGNKEVVSSISGKTFVTFSNFTTAAIYETVIATADSTESGISPVIVSGASVSIDGVKRTTDSNGKVSYNLTSLLVTKLNVTKSGYNDYRDFNIGLQQVISYGLPLNLLLLTPLVPSNIVLESQYQVDWFENFSQTKSPLGNYVANISRLGWFSRQSNIFMNRDFRIKPWQTTFGNVLVMNNTVAGLFVNHRTETTTSNNEFYFRLYVDNKCPIYYGLTCTDWNLSDYVKIQYGSYASNPSIELRVWYNGTSDRYHIDYYDGFQSKFINCLKLKRTFYVPFDYKIIKTDTTYSVYVYNSTFGQDSYYLGNSGANWNTCVQDEALAYFGNIEEMSVLSVPISSGEIVIDKIYAADSTATNCSGNIAPVISQIGYATGNPLCANTSQVFELFVNDPENDYYSVKWDCYGNDSWSDWSILTQSSSYAFQCHYNEVGTYTVGFKVTDLCRYPYDTGVLYNYLLTVATNNCYNFGQGAGNTGESMSEEANGFIYQFNDTIDGYKSTTFNMDICTSWEQSWRAIFLPICPIYSLGVAILSTLFNWVFSIYFGIFLLILIIIVVIIGFRRRH